MASQPTNSQGIESSIRDILLHIGEDPQREGLKDTPARVRRSFDKLYGGYKLCAKDVLKTTFADGRCDEMVVLRNIEFYSMCEHHMLPFYGRVHIAYIPGKYVVGISKLARLVEVYSRRLQIQERMTTQIAADIMTILKARGAMVVVKAQHHCMTSRGVEKQNSEMVTSAIRGEFLKEKARNEFFGLLGI